MGGRCAAHRGREVLGTPEEFNTALRRHKNYGRPQLVVVRMPEVAVYPPPTDLEVGVRPRRGGAVVQSIDRCVSEGGTTARARRRLRTTWRGGASSRAEAVAS